MEDGRREGERSKGRRSEGWELTEEGKVFVFSLQGEGWLWLGSDKVLQVGQARKQTKSVEGQWLSRFEATGSLESLSSMLCKGIHLDVFVMRILTVSVSLMSQSAKEAKWVDSLIWVDGDG